MVRISKSQGDKEPIVRGHALCRAGETQSRGLRSYLAVGFLCSLLHLLATQYSMMQYVVWGMGALAAYNLWGEITWLSILVALIALSYGVHDDEQIQQNATGEFATSTANRLLWTFIIVAGILIYSFI